MDAPAMFTRKQVPEDVGLRNTGAAEEGGQGQLHRESEQKEHKPVLKKVKEKVKQIKHSLTGHSHGHGDDQQHGQQHDTHADYDDSDEEEEGDAALEREVALEKGGYMDDVEDNKTVAAEPDPEVHGAPMYESERTPAVHDLVAKYDPQARAPAAREAHGADAPGVRFGNLGSHGFHDPADASGARFGDLGGPGFHDPAAREAQHGADASGARFSGLGGTGFHDPAAQEARHGADNRLGGTGFHDPAAQEARHGADAPGVRFGGLGGPGFHGSAAQRDESPKVRLGDIGGHVVEDPAAPQSRTPAARQGEDIGATPMVKEFESMTLSDDPSHVGAAKQGARAEEWKDAAANKLGAGGTASSGGAATYTDKIKNVAAVPAEYGWKIASTVYEKVAGGGTAVNSGNEHASTEAVPVSDAGVGGEEFKDAPADVDTTTTMTTDRSSTGPGYTDKIKSTAAGTTEYGKQLASTVYNKVAGGGAGGQEFKDAPADVDTTTTTTDRSSAPGYTDNIKSTASGTTEYGKQLASTVYDKVAGVAGTVAPSLRPQVGSGKPEEGRRAEAMLDDLSADDTRKEERGAAATTAAAANNAAAGPGYTEKIKSAAAGTTEYGKQLASSVYEKVAGVGTAVVGKVQQATQSAGSATPGVGAQQDNTSTTVTPGAGGAGNGQDKGVTMTGYIAEKLRPSEEDRELSCAISGAVQRRKEEVGGTVGQRVPAPSSVITKAREAVTALTGGTRESETVQPEAATGAEVKENVAAEAPVLRGEEIGEPKLNTNTM